MAEPRLPECCGLASQQIKRALDEHEGSLVRYAQHFVGDLDRARDVVQDTFLKLCDQLNAKAEQGSPAMLDDESHLASWLFRVCRNRAIDVSRKENRMKVGIQELNGRPAEQLQPPEAVQQKEIAASVMSQISMLPENQQEVLRLKFHAGLSYKEISEVTGLTSTNVGFLLHTAIKRLRTRLADA